MRKIRTLYKTHKGKVSDKWEIYLPVYDRCFKKYADKPVSVLEIGVQNGGSLEIWSKYFKNATAILGCDINTKCSELEFDDPRISMLVGDVNSSKVYDEIIKTSSAFDIIIDDGSHLSSDIVKTFSLYFEHIKNDGFFIFEDLHCSYWESFEGGLYDPYSSISFFKRLADIIHYEHWGLEKSRSEFLNGFFEKYNCRLCDEALAQVHSVEFVNSMCIIHKKEAALNGLGLRVIAGKEEHVVQGHHKLHGKTYRFLPGLEQVNNPWSNVKHSLEEEYFTLDRKLSKSNQDNKALNKSLIELQGNYDKAAKVNRDLSDHVKLIEKNSHKDKENISALSDLLLCNNEQLIDCGRRVDECQLVVDQQAQALEELTSDKKQVLEENGRLKKRIDSLESIEKSKDKYISSREDFIKRQKELFQKSTQDLSLSKANCLKLEAELKAMEASLQKCTQDLSLSKENCLKLEAKIKTMEDSYSWRLTKVFRDIKK